VAEGKIGGHLAYEVIDYENYIKPAEQNGRKISRE